MVKKVKRFIVFLLFSFFYSLLSGKTASAAANNKICIVPKNSDGNLMYNGQAVSGVIADQVDPECDYN